MAPGLAGIFFLFYLLPGVLGISLIQFTHFALFSLIVPFALLSALGNLALYKEKIEVERSAQEEKDRIMENLHDTTLNNLSRITAAIDVAPKENQDTEKIFSLIRTVTVDTSRHLRELLQVIEEDHIEYGKSWKGFCILLREIGFSETKDKEISLKLNIAEALINLPPPTLKVKVLVYQVYKEALVNAIRHAGANKINCTVSYTDNWIVFEINDNGHGFDSALQRKGHFGLSLMQKRVEKKLKGKLSIHAHVIGTTVTFTFPRD